MRDTPYLTQTRQIQNITFNPPTAPQNHLSPGTPSPSIHFPNYPSFGSHSNQTSQVRAQLEHSLVELEIATTSLQQPILYPPTCRCDCRSGSCSVLRLSSAALGVGPALLNRPALSVLASTKHQAPSTTTQRTLHPAPHPHPDPDNSASSSTAPLKPRHWQSCAPTRRLDHPAATRRTPGAL